MLVRREDGELAAMGLSTCYWVLLLALLLLPKGLGDRMNNWGRFRHSSEKLSRAVWRRSERPVVVALG